MIDSSLALDFSQVLRTKVWEKTPVAGSWCGVHVVSEHRPFYQFSPAKSGGSLSVCRADSIKRGTSLATRPYLLLRCYPPTFLQLFITEEGELFCVDIGGSNSVVLCQRPWPSRRSPRVVTCGRRRVFFRGEPTCLHAASCILGTCGVRFPRQARKWPRELQVGELGGCGRMAPLSRK